MTELLWIKVKQEASWSRLPTGKASIAEGEKFQGLEKCTQCTTTLLLYSWGTESSKMSSTISISEDILLVLYSDKHQSKYISSGIAHSLSYTINVSRF